MKWPSRKFGRDATRSTFLVTWLGYTNWKVFWFYSPVADCRHSDECTNVVVACHTRILVPINILNRPPSCVFLRLVANYSRQFINLPTIYLNIAHERVFLIFYLIICQLRYSYLHFSENTFFSLFISPVYNCNPVNSSLLIDTKCIFILNIYWTVVLSFSYYTSKTNFILNFSPCLYKSVK